MASLTPKDADSLNYFLFIEQMAERRLAVLAQGITKSGGKSLPVYAGAAALREYTNRLTSLCSLELIAG